MDYGQGGLGSVEFHHKNEHFTCVTYSGMHKSGKHITFHSVNQLPTRPKMSHPVEQKSI
jgi:hypothetical protein